MGDTLVRYRAVVAEDLDEVYGESRDVAQDGAAEAVDVRDADAADDALEVVGGLFSDADPGGRGGLGVHSPRLPMPVDAAGRTPCPTGAGPSPAPFVCCGAPIPTVWPWDVWTGTPGAPATTPS